MKCTSLVRNSLYTRNSKIIFQSKHLIENTNENTSIFIHVYKRLEINLINKEIGFILYDSRFPSINTTIIDNCKQNNLQPHRKAIKLTVII